MLVLWYHSPGRARRAAPCYDGSMSQPRSPLAVPAPWDRVALAYEAEAVPQLETFAAEALRLAPVGPGTRAVDVAAGPGTLALLAARAGARVTALDFAPEMVARLRRRADSLGLELESCVGDGMALPFPDGAFDRAYSMFGLIFFPDPARGLREMRRVLAPDGRAVVSSWQPMSRTPLFAAAFDALRAHVPGLPANDGRATLGSPDDLAAAMEEAGFYDVEAREATNTVEVTSAEALWESMQRATAPVVLLKERVGAAWAEVASSVAAALRASYDDGPQSLTMFAVLGVGSAPR